MSLLCLRQTTTKMDLAYDHIVEESLPKEDDGKRPGDSGAEQTQNSLNAEIQDAYKAFSASPWGAKIGGFFGTVVKQVRFIALGSHGIITSSCNKRRCELVHSIRGRHG